MKDFSWPISAFNETEFRKFVSKAEENSASMRGREVYIFGSGIRGCCFLKFCEIKKIEVTGFIDNDPNKEGGCIGRYRIHSFEVMAKRKEPYYVIVSPENAEEIVRQLTGNGLMQGKDFFSVEAGLYDEFVKKFFRKDGYSCLFLGDCIFSQVGIKDERYDSFEKMLYDEFGRDKANVLGMHGMPIRTFYHLVRLFFSKCMRGGGRIPKKIILAVNTVMFTGKKNQLPRAQHTPLLKKISDRLGFEDSEFEDYIKLTEERMERFQTDAFVTTDSNVQNRNSMRIAALKMKLNYMYSLDETEEGVVYPMLTT